MKQKKSLSQDGVTHLRKGISAFIGRRFYLHRIVLVISNPS
jgi:hypothetical protein